jgi:ankyrin repeat protein
MAYYEFLAYAAKKGELEKGAVRSLVLTGTGINSKNRFGETHLHLAAAKGHLEIAEFLVGSGADKEAKNNKNQTPLHLAAERHHWVIVKFLVESGAHKEAKDEKGWTPLHHSISIYGNTGMVEFLVKSGADITAKNNKGQTPFQLAQKYGREEASDYLRNVVASTNTGLSFIFF